jgi:hypothetical protein
MHVVVPFAVPSSDAARSVWRALSWSGARRWWEPRRRVAREVGAIDDWSAPHERALAAALGWAQAADGLIPLAALAAAEDGVPDDGRPLAWLTPSHWHLGTEQIGMTDPQALQLDEATSRTLFDAAAPLFTSEGYGVAWASATRWYLMHEELATTRTASLDRVIGRNVDPWLGSGARRLRRLQNEVQMLWHDHPANTERERAGLPVVNSVWISGSGPRLALPAPSADAPAVEPRLRSAALAEDWSAWAQAWAVLDREWGEAPPQRLTLCGEAGWATFDLEPRGLPQSAVPAGPPGRWGALKRWLGLQGPPRSVVPRHPAQAPELEGL